MITNKWQQKVEIKYFEKLCEREWIKSFQFKDMLQKEVVEGDILEENGGTVLMMYGTHTKM